VTTGYYRNSDAQLAAGALRHWLRMIAASEEGQLANLMTLFYVFARDQSGVGGSACRVRRSARRVRPAAAPSRE
jgi:hypothetical protein